jgi:hypothetical protein
VADYSQPGAEQELGLRPSYLKELLVDNTMGIRGSLRRGRELEWKCVHAHENASDARQCAREELRSRWFASHGETVRKVTSPGDLRRLSVNANAAGQRGLNLARELRGWDMTEAANRALDLLGDTLELMSRGGQVKFVEPDGGESVIRFLG